MTAMSGYAAPGFEPVADAFAEFAKDDGYAAQLAAYSGGELVLDLAAGIERDSIMVLWSATKGASAVALAVLVDRGLLDLDEKVAAYWPEFAQYGKEQVTVRQLLSHQAGLPEVDGMLSWDEVIDQDRAVERLAAQRPLWQPGSAFGYHALTIGVFMGELCRRITGLPIQQFYESEVRAPRGIDLYLGLPEVEEHRVVPLLPMLPLTPDQQQMQAGALADRGVFAELVLGERPGSGLDARGIDPGADMMNSRLARELGLPAATGVGSARGLAQLYQAATGFGTPRGLVSADTLEAFAQTQVAGYDLVLDRRRSHGIVFQKPAPGMRFGSHRAFGHDGAGGALGFADPVYGLGFGYTVQRTPFPGGVDERALVLAGLLRTATGAIR